MKYPLVTEETGLLEEPPYECLSPADNQCDDTFATCSVSVTYCYEVAGTLDPSKKKDSPPTATRKGSPVVETEGQVTPLSRSIVPPNRRTDVLGPAEKSDPLKKDIHPTTNPSPKVHPYGAKDALNP